MSTALWGACARLLTRFIQDNLAHIVDEIKELEQAARNETEVLSKKHSVHEKQAVDAQSRLNDIARSLELQQS